MTENENESEALNTKCEAELFFKLMPKKDTENILKGIAEDIKRDGVNKDHFNFLVGLITENITMYSKYEPQLLNLSATNIASSLLK